MMINNAVVSFRYLPPIKPEDKLRNLAKDGRDNLKDKYQVNIMFIFNMYMKMIYKNNSLF